jgi:uncharacterized protein (DUF2062 family)
MRQWLYRRIVAPLIDLLRQGVTPEKIALSIALGVVLGVFPVLGSTTLLCAAAALILRLNLPAIQMVNYFVYPLQLILFIPFLQAGSRMVGARPITMSLAEIFSMMKSDLWGLTKLLWSASLGAMVMWLILAPVAAAAIYFTIAPMLRGLRRTAGGVRQ